MKIGIGNAISKTTSGGEPAIITATTSPSLGALTDGDTLSSAVTWGSYSSTEGTISGTVREMSVNGGAYIAYDGTTVVSFDDTYLLRETVTDSAANEREFFSAPQTVAGIAPTITASDSLTGRTLTITVDSTTGTPTPTTALTTLTLDGATVSPTTTGSGTWTYEVPDSASSQTVAWTVTASNDAGDDTASGSEVIASNLSAPTITASDSLSGRTLTITVDSTTGNPSPTTSLTTLTLDGSDVLGNETGTGPWTYEVPDNGSDRTVAWTVTATNSVDSATASGSETVLDVDADAQDWIDRVETAESTTLEQTLKDAVDALVKDLKADGIWAKRNLILLAAGPPSILGVEEQLKGSFSAGLTNYSSPLYDRATGLTGNGTGSFFNTGYPLNTESETDNAYTVHITEILGVSGDAFLSNDPNEVVVEDREPWLLIRKDLVRAQNSTAVGYTLGTSEPAYICLARNSSTTAELTVRGSTQTISNTAVSPTVNDTFQVHAQHQNNIFGESRVAYTSAGEFLTQTERANEKAAIETYMTAISGLT